jgi:8-oxo-dGTP pyrophosphatase MutT (NUDIX family)
MTQTERGPIARPRRAARVLLVDAQDRVLLFRGTDPARPDEPYWFTPGGGLDTSEMPAAGAARELAEETGLVLTPEELGEPVHREVAHFSYLNVAYRQEQEFFLVRVPAWEVDTSGFDVEEANSIDMNHWWSVSDLSATTERFYPLDLVAVLHGLGIGPC